MQSDLTFLFSAESSESIGLFLVHPDFAESSTSALSDRVKQALLGRPSISWIYILLPFDFSELRTDQFVDFSAIDRSVNHGIPKKQICFVQLSRESNKFIFTAADEDADLVVLANNFDLASRACASQLIRAHRGIDVAPDGVHFGKTSSRHSVQFLRPSNVLTNSEACLFVAFCCWRFVQLGANKILIDTGGMLGVGIQLGELIALGRGLESRVTVSSFGSYAGARQIVNPHSGELYLISASTSGGLDTELQKKGVRPNQIVTLFSLDRPARESSHQVLFNLLKEPDNPEGFEVIESQKSNDCKWCNKGFFVADLEGDQFRLGSRKIKAVALGELDQKQSQRALIKEILEAKSVSFALCSDVFGFRFSATNILAADGELKEAFLFLAKKAIPAGVKFFVDSADAIEDSNCIYNLLESERLIPSGTKRIIPSQIDTQEAKAQGCAVVLEPILTSTTSFVLTNQRIRRLVPKGVVSYLSIFSVYSASAEFKAVLINLKYGERGKDTFEVSEGKHLLLTPQRKDCAWQKEAALLDALANSESLLDDNRRLLYLGRSRLIQQGSILSENELFWTPRGDAPRIQPDFIFLDNSDPPATQLAVSLAISNVLATAFDELTKKQSNGQLNSVYGKTNLDVKNFQRFNDAVLHAALLRFSSSEDLNYVEQLDSSNYLVELIRNQLEAFIMDRPNSFFEFWLALAGSRLSLHPEAFDAIASAIKEKADPEFFNELR